MRKVSLGTHYTLLGYHPENKRDLTPMWFRVANLVGLWTVLFLLLTYQTILGEKIGLGLVLLFVSIQPLAVAIFNRKQKTNYIDAFFAILFLGLGALYLFGRP